MNMDQNDLNVLDEVNKGATMGMDAIEFIEKKVGDEKFRTVLNDEYGKYQEISKRANDIYESYTYKKDPHETSAMTKVMTWWGVQMKSMSDKSNSNLSEMLLTGTNMGVIEGRRLINQNDNAANDVKSILHEFVTMQEESVEILKKYL